MIFDFALLALILGTFMASLAIVELAWAFYERLGRD